MARSGVAPNGHGGGAFPNWVRTKVASWMQGDGRGGSLAVTSGTTTLTKTEHRTTVTVDPGATLDVAGYLLATTELIDIAGTLVSGTLASRHAVSNAAVTYRYNHYGINPASGAGGTAGGGAVNDNFFLICGGNGGVGGSGSGGSGGAITNYPILNHVPFLLPTLFAGTSLASALGASRIMTGGQSGSGGGGDGTAGGGGGAGGPLIVLAAPRIVIRSGGLIDARGGNGFTPAAGNRGGGGAGGGGYVVLLCDELDLGGTINVAAGTPGSGTGTGTAGAAGEAGRYVVCGV